MTLPPKTQHEFEQWFIYQPWYGQLLMNDCIHIKTFELLPFAFQQGVYQEFFRSVGIETLAKHSCTRYRYFAKWYIIHDPFSDEYKGGFSDYATALLAALNAAAELREGQLEKSL